MLALFENWGSVQVLIFVGIILGSIVVGSIFMGLINNRFMQYEGSDAPRVGAETSNDGVWALSFLAFLAVVAVSTKIGYSCLTDWVGPSG